MRGKWVLCSLLVLLLAAVGAAVSVLRTARPPARRVPPAVAAAAAPAAPAAEISLPGRIEAQQVVPVGQDAAGEIQQFTADVGQEVAEGQVLAQLTSQGLESTRQLASEAAEGAQARVSRIETELVAARLEASRTRADATRSRIEFERAESAYRRQSTLNDAGATPRLVYEKARGEYETAQSEFRSLDELARQAESRVQALNDQLDSAKKLLSDKTQSLDTAQASLQSMQVQAPVSGIVVARRGEAGQPHQAGQALFDIAADPANLQAVVDAEPSFIARLRPGQPALVIVADLQQALPGTVRQLRGNQVVVAFTSPSPVVRPGMTAQVKLKAQ